MLALVLVLASVAVPRQAVAVTATTGWTLKGMMAVLQTMELLTVLRWELRSRQRGMCSGTLRACVCVGVCSTACLPVRVSVPLCLRLWLWMCLWRVFERLCAIVVSPLHVNARAHPHIQQSCGARACR